MTPRHAQVTQIGPAGATVSRLGLGASVIGGLFAPVAEEDARAVVESALALGLRYVDTAPLYGLGFSERRVGEVLRTRNRDSFTLSTKVGRLVRRRSEQSEVIADGTWHVPPDIGAVFDFSRDGIRASLEESLERLGLDRVDIAFVHDPDAHLEQACAEALPALAELRDEGLVGAIGAGMNDAASLASIVREARPDCVLLAGRYSLLDQSALDDLLPLCVAKRVAVVVGGALNSGILADPAPGARYDYVEADTAVLARARLAATVCADHGVPLAAAALQFPLGHPAVCSVLVGVRSVAELAANVAMFDADLPSALWDDLVSAGILCDAARHPIGAAA